MGFVVFWLVMGVICAVVALAKGAALLGGFSWGAYLAP